MTSFKEFINEVYGDDNMVLGCPPRHSKSFMSEAITTMYNNYKAAYDEVYLSVFNELKEGVVGISDEEIHNFIEKYITFELEVENRGFTEPPKIFITPKLDFEGVNE